MRCRIAWGRATTMCSGALPSHFGFGDLDCLMLDPTRMLFHTAIHGLRWNEESPIRWIVDAMMILRTAGHEIDWTALADQADAMQMSDRLHRALAYLEAEFDAPIDTGVLERLARAANARSSASRNASCSAASTRGSRQPARAPLDLLRPLWPRGATRDAVGIRDRFTHYMRFRWQLRGRKRNVGYVLRGSASASGDGCGRRRRRPPRHVRRLRHRAMLSIQRAFTRDDVRRFRFFLDATSARRPARSRCTPSLRRCSRR